MDAVTPDLQVSLATGSGLVARYVEGDAGAVRFFGRHFRAAGDYRSKAEEVDRRFDRHRREVAASALRVPQASTDRVRRWVEEGGWMVTTGQQPGLFGGPMYSVYKALTAVRLARALEETLGRPVLPVFWVASEDHDWAEANHTTVVGLDNLLHRIEVPAPSDAVHPPLFRVPVGDAWLEARQGFLAHLPETEFSGPFRALIEHASEPGLSLPESFHAIIDELLGPRGLVFVDAAEPALKEASRELLLAEAERGAELEEVLAGTGRALEEAGQALQVPLLEGALNLFLEGAAGRERLYRDDGGYRLRTSDEHLTADDLRARVADDPRCLSPNVLLRPVVESHVLPTLAYVAGPGEMAYYAQLDGYFRAHGIEMPVIHPRHSVTVVERRIRKVLDKFDVGLPDLARPFHELASERARDEVPEDVRRAIGGLRGAIARGVADVQKAVQRIDPTLKGPAQHVRSHALDALGDLERKVVAALKREQETALAQLEKAQNHLVPGGRPQERVLNPFVYLTRYGGPFLDALEERFEVKLS